MGLLTLAYPDGESLIPGTRKKVPMDTHSKIMKKIGDDLDVHEPPLDPRGFVQMHAPKIEVRFHQGDIDVVITKKHVTLPFNQEMSDKIVKVAAEMEVHFNRIFRY